MVAVKYVPFLFSLCFHEFAHGFVAKMRGDRTAEMMGRLTLNPLAHMDFIGTFLFPVIAFATGSSFMFGWAKPVPVNSRNLKNPRTDMFWVALAGPLSNIFLALVGAFLLVLTVLFFQTSQYYGAMKNIVEILIVMNLSLAFFNLIPIHPLDGGKVLARFLPAAWNQKLEEHEQMLSIALMLLIFSGGLQFLIYPIQWTYHLLMSLALGVLT